MTYPTDDVMESFLVMARSLGISTDSGEIEAFMPDPTVFEGFRDRVIPGEHIDELVTRGWLVLIGEDEIESSESGIYHLNRWRARREKEERRKRATRYESKPIWSYNRTGRTSAPTPAGPDREAPPG